MNGIDLCQRYGPCKRAMMKDFGMYSGEWYFLSITPLPDKEEIECVIYDILNGNDISMLDGQLRHNPNCEVKNHKLPKRYKKIASNLSKVTYNVAIFSNHLGLLLGQPIALCIDPLITYNNYPEHPHLNMPVIGEDYCPPSLCYTDNPDDLGHMFGDRIFDAMFHVTEWLFRHQIWEMHRELFGNGKWIGPEAESGFKNGEYVRFLNPNGNCRCSSNLRYFECCMKEDIKLYLNHINSVQSTMQLKATPNLLTHMKVWRESILEPEAVFVKEIDDIFNQLEF